MRGPDLGGHRPDRTTGACPDTPGYDDEEESSMPWIPKPTDRIDLPRAYHWSDDAACRGTAPAVFFPVGRGGVPVATEAEYAKSLCGPCPVREECLQHALAFGEEGVWGGLDDNERTEMFRKARRVAKRQQRQQDETEVADATAAA